MSPKSIKIITPKTVVDDSAYKQRKPKPPSPQESIKPPQSSPQVSTPKEKPQTSKKKENNVSVLK